MTQALKYLENFWIPKVGNSVMYSGSIHKIDSIEESNPEQIFLCGVDEVVFIQDCEWSPTFSDLDSILQKFGIRVCADCLQFKQLFLKKPESFEDYASAIREIRNLGYHNGEEVLDGYFRSC